MKKVTYFLGLLFFTTLIACKNEPSANAKSEAPIVHADIKQLNGHWIAADFCARANQYGSVLGAMNNAHIPYAFTFTFDAEHPDSVTCFNTAESWKLPLSIRLDTIELKEARPGKSLFFMYEPRTKELMLIDGTSGAVQTDRFIKSSAQLPNGYRVFSMALNKHLFEGSFECIVPKLDKPVLFNPDASIVNFKDYDRYQVCTGGDCFIVRQPMDIITMANTAKKDPPKMFGFKYSAKNDTLSIYNIKMDPNVKAADLGSLAYRFVKKNIVPPSTPKK